MTRRYKAFISYSWADRTWGEWLHRTLETYRAPKGVADGQSLHPIFKDREEEAAGGSVGAAIEAALAASEFLIVICSPRSAKSAWVNREIAWFKTHKDKGRILALIVDGEPGAGATPGRESEECFPKTLTRKVGADLQPTEEWEDAPLAADARPEGDGKRGAKLKLAAALLGVGLDALVRRDERRRTIRRRWVTSAAFGLAAMLGGLAIYAFTQRDAAVIARNDAVTARDDAEEIIELILTDLKSDLEGYGTLKSVTQIGNRAIGYYEGQDVKALTPDQLGRRARVLLMLGEADNKRGDLTAALARYKTAEATTSEQLARDPDNAQRIFDHAQSVFWVGYIAWQRGDHAKAKAQFTEYHRLATRLVEIDPLNDDWQAELEYSYSNLGTLAMDEGDAAEAEGWFRKSLEVSLERLKVQPSDADRVSVAGQSYAWLADALYKQIRLTEASAARRAEIALYEQHQKLQKNDKEVIAAMEAAQRGLAHIEHSLGNSIAATELAKEAIVLADQVLSADPDRIEALNRAALARAAYAETALFLGRHAETKRILQEGISIAEKLVSIDSATIQWSSITLSQLRLMLVKSEVFGGHAGQIGEFLDLLIEDQSRFSEQQEHTSVRRILIAALSIRARLGSQSESDYGRIINIASNESEKETIETQVCLAEALLETQRYADAERIIIDLYRSGYRHPEFKEMLERRLVDRAALENGN